MRTMGRILRGVCGLYIRGIQEVDEKHGEVALNPKRGVKGLYIRPLHGKIALDHDLPSYEAQLLPVKMEWGFPLIW